MLILPRKQLRLNNESLRFWFSKMATKRQHVYTSVSSFLLFYRNPSSCLFSPRATLFSHRESRWPIISASGTETRWRRAKWRKNSVVIAGTNLAGGIIGFVRWTRITSSEVEWNHKQKESGWRIDIAGLLSFTGSFSLFLPPFLLLSIFIPSRRSHSLFQFFSSLTLFSHLFPLPLSFVRSFARWFLLFEFQRRRRRNEIERERPRGSNGFLANSGSERSSVKPIRGLDSTGSRWINKFSPNPLLSRRTRVLIFDRRARFRRPLRRRGAENSSSRVCARREGK